MEKEASFEGWAIVELYGRNIIVGDLSEQLVAGSPMLRVDVPAVDGQDGFTKFYGSGAIYAITPTDKDTALSAVAGLRKKPIEVWKLNLPQLQAPERSERHPLDGYNEDFDDGFEDDF